MTIPRSLVQAVSDGRIVPFVGSGVSMAVKKGLFPSWDHLLLNLAEKLDEEANEDTAEIVRRYVKKNDNAGRVLRGGSGLDDADVCRSSIRVNFDPGLRFSNVGFRVARTL